MCLDFPFTRQHGLDNGNTMTRKCDPYSVLFWNGASSKNFSVYMNPADTHCPHTHTNTHLYTSIYITNNRTLLSKLFRGSFSQSCLPYSVNNNSRTMVPVMQSLGKIWTLIEVGGRYEIFHLSFKFQFTWTGWAVESGKMGPAIPIGKPRLNKQGFNTSFITCRCIMTRTGHMQLCRQSGLCLNPLNIG